MVSRDYHYEMPFEIQVDGPYYSIVDFFSRLSRLSRIINVGDLKFAGLGRACSLSGAPEHNRFRKLRGDDLFCFLYPCAAAPQGGSASRTGATQAGPKT